jgi:hypothetical protein
MADYRTENAFPLSAEAVTKSDSTAVDYSSVYVGGTGDLAVMYYNDSVAVTYSACPVGFTLVGRIKRVMSTNTTATLMVATKN